MAVERVGPVSFANGTVADACAEAAFAYGATTAYRQLIEAEDLVHSVGDVARFGELPFTDKSFYRSNFPAGVVAKPITDNPFVLRSSSSGTSGDRLTTVAYTFDLAKRMLATTSVNPSLREALLRSSDQRVGRYAAPNCSDVECATPNSTIESRTLRDGTLVLPVGHDLLATPERLVDQAIEEIKRYRPNWFYTDATHFAFLLRKYAERELPPPPAAAIVFTYTLATRAARRQVERFHGSTPSGEVVSMSELGWIAMECPLGIMHLNAATFYLEFLDLLDHQPVSVGGMGELVVTSVGDRLQPHVRYRTGDLYRLLEPCPCGSPFPAARHEGRISHLLPLPDRVVTPKDVDEAVGPDPAIIAYRLHQTSRQRLKLAFIPASGVGQAATDGIAQRVGEVLGDDVLLTIDAVDYLPSERSGKFLSCVTDVRTEPTDLVGMRS